MNQSKALKNNNLVYLTCLDNTKNKNLVFPTRSKEFKSQSDEFPTRSVTIKIQSRRFFLKRYIVNSDFVIYLNRKKIFLNHKRHKRS